jgi:hypothetical protein
MKEFGRTVVLEETALRVVPGTTPNSSKPNASVGSSPSKQTPTPVGPCKPVAVPDQLIVIRGVRVLATDSVPPGGTKLDPPPPAASPAAADPPPPPPK